MATMLPSHTDDRLPSGPSTRRSNRSASHSSTLAGRGPCPGASAASMSWRAAERAGPIQSPLLPDPVRWWAALRWH